MLALQDLAERMHVNTAGVAANAYSGINFGALDCSTAPAPFCADSGATAGATCSPAEMATFDAWEAYCAATETLNSPTLSVSANNDLRTLSITWSEPTPEGGFESKSVSMTLHP